LETESNKAVSSDSNSGHDEDPATADCDKSSGSQVHVWSRQQHTWNSGGVWKSMRIEDTKGTS
jgi:hypothetical protein